MIKTLEQLKNSGFSAVVKEWFDKINGNTYHNVKVYINNESCVIGFTYGYERQYIDTILNFLFKNNIIEKNNDMLKSNIRWYVEKQSNIYEVSTQKKCKDDNF